MASIRKTRTGKWELDFYSDGRRQRVTFDTRREAEDAKREVLVGAANPEDAETLKPTSLKDAFRYYEKIKSNGKASHANEKYWFTLLFKHLRGSDCVLVGDVRPEHLEEYKVARLAGLIGKNKCVAATVNREFNAFRHFFAMAVVWKWTAKNPSLDVSTIPEVRNPRRIWTPEEFEKVVRKIPAWAGEVMQVMYWTGAGPKELSRVTWADIDFERKTLLLKRYKGNGDERRRSIFMPDELLEFMRSKFDTAKRSSRAKATDPAFLNSKGNRIAARPLSTLVRRAVAFHGLPEGTVPYGVRHTVATELLEAGVPEDVVRRQLGHASVRTLIENYSHVRDAAMQSAMTVRESQVGSKAKKRGVDGR